MNNLKFDEDSIKSYKLKYHKYKKKYLNLKKKLGGASVNSECEIPKYETPNMYKEKIAENPLCFCEDPECKSIEHVPRIILDDADKTNLVDDEKTILDGIYLYVITTDLPEQIILMEDTRNRFIYCDNDKNIIKKSGSIITKNRINHSNVSLNKNVLSAGMLRIGSDNHIIVNTESGHYKPWIEGGEYTACLLEKKGYEVTREFSFIPNDLIGQITARRNRFKKFKNDEEKEKIWTDLGITDEQIHERYPEDADLILKRINDLELERVERMRKLGK